eukprot:jgi/Tetstr1/448858/TSEL_036084.t1
MERPNFAVDEVGGLALTYGNAQSEGSAFPRMLAVAGAALDIDMDTPHTDEAYTDRTTTGPRPMATRAHAILTVQATRSATGIMHCAGYRGMTTRGRARRAPRGGGGRGATAAAAAPRQCTGLLA